MPPTHVLSVQPMERCHEEYRRLGDKEAAIRRSYLGLFSPALVSIASDGLAIFSLVIARIAALQKLAIISSFWVFTSSVSVVTLHPILLSFLHPPRHDPKAGKRVTEEYPRFADINHAIEEALMTTGRAILFTGATLTTSVIFWLFFPMKFQSEMVFLLTLILFLHVVGALLFIPVMVSLFKPRFATAGGGASTAE